MEKYKCYGCGYSWFTDSKGNGHASQHACPRCGSDKIHFILKSLFRDYPAEEYFKLRADSCIPFGIKHRYTFKKWMAD